MPLKLFFPCIIIMLLCGRESLSQETSQGNLILIHGIVMDASTQQSIANTHYFINGLSSGNSGADGKFSVYVYRGDTIRFTFLGYSDVTCLTDTLPGNSYVAGIFMETDTLNIGEVLVFPRMGDLRSEFMNSSSDVSPEMLNARNNILVSTYQGVNSSATLGDAGANYDMIRRKQVINAYEMGGISSGRMVGLNFFSLIPASIYLLANGFPEKPEPPNPFVSSSELERIKKEYRERLKEKDK